MGKPTKHKAKKRFGQNFLHDASIIQRIVDAIHPQPGDQIVEIGPGQGAEEHRESQCNKGADFHFRVHLRTSILTVKMSTKG